MGIMKRFAAVIHIVFVGASMSACTTAERPLPHKSSPDIHGSPSSSPGTEALPTIVHAGSMSLPWHIQHSDDTHNRISLSSHKEQCSVPYAATVEETTTPITITVHGSKNLERCTADMVTIVGYVQLTNPRGGGRSILHAAISSR